MKVLITGGSGFVGSRLIPRLDNAGHQLRFLSRTINSNAQADNTYLYDLSSPNNELGEAFSDIDIVIHLASKVHDLSDSQNTNDYTQINVAGTHQLLKAAVEHDVKRFIYLSSIKVHGDSALRSITEQSDLNPEDPYAHSKLKCEELIKTVCESHAMEYVIIRPPLVYGPGVKANFYNLIKLVGSGMPIPLAAIKNQRSMIYVDNLCDFISQCTTDYKATNQIFVIKDFDVSTPELITKIAKALDKPNRLFPMPVWILKIIGSITKKNKQLSRLVESLTIDHTQVSEQMNWQPIIQFDQCIYKTVEWYQMNKSK